MSVPNHEIVTAYRHLYQHLLKAVRYAKPARFLCRDRIRHAFRNSPPESFDTQRLANTLHFLDCASKSAGLEHKILKNFVFVNWERRSTEMKPIRHTERHLRKQAYARFDQTIEKFNESMSLCIK